MKSIISLPVAGLVLLNVRLGLCQTSVEDIIADISPSMRDDHSTFWASDPQNQAAAAAFALANGHMTIRDADPNNRWRNADPATQTNWSRAYARLSSGTGFVFWKDTEEIPESADPNWQAEKDEMTSGGKMFEIIQVNRDNTANFLQIWPSELEGIDISQCTWTACGTTTCATGEETAHSMYSDNVDITARCPGNPGVESARTLCC